MDDLYRYDESLRKKGYLRVAGIDEADIVKTDGNYLYVVSNNQIYILEAYPASEMKILCNFSVGLYDLQLLVDGDRLVVIGNNYTMFYEVNGG
jgi:uncharacterized secreted protein with C-terminal beta-propeller domain